MYGAPNESDPRRPSNSIFEQKVRRRPPVIFLEHHILEPMISLLLLTAMREILVTVTTRHRAEHRPAAWGNAFRPMFSNTEGQRERSSSTHHSRRPAISYFVLIRSAPDSVSKVKGWRTRFLDQHQLNDPHDEVG